MAKRRSKVLNLVQIILEIIVAVGYLSGLIPFVYFFVSFGIIPLIIINIILGFVNRNGTVSFSIANLIMAVLSFIPIFGYVTRIIGAILSILNAIKLAR